MHVSFTVLDLGTADPLGWLALCCRGAASGHAPSCHNAPRRATVGTKRKSAHTPCLGGWGFPRERKAPAPGPPLRLPLSTSDPGWHAGSFLLIGPQRAGG